MRAGGTYAASSGEILKFFNSPPKLSPNWHKLACVTESLNPCSLHRHFITQARQTQHLREARDEGLVALRSKYRVCRAWLINAVIHINEINIHIEFSIWVSSDKSGCNAGSILTSEPARIPLTSQGGVQKNARRYEFYFRMVKQYLRTSASSRRAMFFLLYRQNDIDKIIEGNYQNYVIDKFTCEIMENKLLGFRM